MAKSTEKKTMKNRILSPFGIIPTRHSHYHIRFAPCKKAESLATVAADEVFVYLGESKKGWNLVTNGKVVGWLSARAGDIQIGTMLRAKEGCCAKCILREKPDRLSKELFIVEPGDKLMYLNETVNGWKRVYFNGLYGWVSARAVK